MVCAIRKLTYTVYIKYSCLPSTVTLYNHTEYILKMYLLIFTIITMITFLYTVNKKPTVTITTVMWVYVTLGVTEIIIVITLSVYHTISQLGIIVKQKIQIIHHFSRGILRY